MTCALGSEKQQQLLEEVVSFVAQAPGLMTETRNDGRTRIQQRADGKFIDIAPEELEEVLFRSDTEGRLFLQINFATTKKILVTESILGFKPIPVANLDSAKIPKVVTTLDIHSVAEVIQDALHAQDSNAKEVNLLKSVLEAVIAGGESVGFDLSAERKWITRLALVSSLKRTSA